MNRKMTKKLAEIASLSMMLGLSGGYGDAYSGYLDGLLPAKGSSKKTYENKNSNIEYYTDEKGNIRRRKVTK